MMIRLSFLFLSLTLILSAGVARADVPVAAPAFGLVNLSAANFRSLPAQSAELASQASFGSPVKILDDQGAWIFAELPDGYQAWVDRPSLAILNPDQMARWRQAPRLVVTSMAETRAIADSLAGFVPDNIVSDLVLGSILEGEPPLPGAHFTPVSFPDGRAGFVSSAAVEPLDSWVKVSYSPQAILSAAYSLMGVPYLWGGTTTKGVDCSGLVKTAFLASALILPRNASDQARCGIAVDHSSPSLFEPGDLLFFSPEDDPDSDHITHVAIYDGGNLYIHSSGRVRVNSFSPESIRFIPRPIKRVIRAALPGRELPGVVRIENHPWYFSL
ncbi:MAG: C40 family peptidase [Pseudoflavonifractor sp.]|nr:C40 family peptidase [Alloprevotella sp.]MCM1116387.1 C40 family peptidase [Pseudoflavonifractor sp.]